MKNILVVGGTSGIGNDVCKKLSAEGCNVHVISRGTKDIEKFSGVTYGIWDATTATLPEIPFEQLDGLVYCPGSINLKPFHRITDAEFEDELNVNTLGAVRVLKASLPHLKKSVHASIVLFSTVAVQTGMPFHSSIAMAKGAVEGLVRSLAAEWAPNIRVNAIAPSLTNTPLAEKLLATPEKTEASAKRHPLGRIGQPTDIAECVVFLLSDKSSWITGQVLHVDGGMGRLKSL